MQKAKFMLTVAILAGAAVLAGCGHISKSMVSEATMLDKAEMATGVDVSRLSIVPGSIMAEMDAVHYKVKSKNGQTWRCYFTSAIAVTSDAVCKQISGKAIKQPKQKPGACNDLLRAAGRC